MADSDTSDQRIKIQEFLNASADDILFLRKARDALLSHPKMLADEYKSESAVCRIMAVLAVSAMDRILEMWRGDDSLCGYFKERQSNAKKIASLSEFFAKSAVTPDAEIISDYLAIKYLRNTVVHTEWKGTQTESIKKRGFPIYLRDLDHTHWDRIVRMMLWMLRSIAKVALSNRQIDAFDRDYRVGKTADLQMGFGYGSHERLVESLIRPADLPALYWRNLEKISFWLERELIEPTDYVSNLALEAWSEYLRLSTEGRGIDLKQIDTNLRTLERFHADGVYARHPIGSCGLLAFSSNIPLVKEHAQKLGLGAQQVETVQRGFETIADANKAGQLKVPAGQWLQLWNASIPDHAVADVLPLFVADFEAIDPRAVVSSLRVGHVVHSMMPSEAHVPVALFLSQLPQFFSANRAKLIAAGRVALALYKLRDAWHSWVESIEQLPIKPHYDIWHRFDRLVAEHAEDGK